MFDILAFATSPTQWLIVLVIVLLLFGGSRIPEMMRGLGAGMKEFKKGLREDEEEKENEDSKKEAAGKR